MELSKAKRELCAQISKLTELVMGPDGCRACGGFCDCRLYNKGKTLVIKTYCYTGDEFKITIKHTDSL